MSSDSPVTTTESARALASRRNGARSRGPRTAAGKARSSRNALRHGLCATKLLVLPEEDAVAFKALEAALLEELTPVGPLQAVLAGRVVSAAWRLARADRMEAEVLALPALRRRRSRARPDPRRQRHPELRHPAALPQRRHGRAPACAENPPGAPGRGQG